jgi:hypothetical protein
MKEIKEVTMTPAIPGPEKPLAIQPDKKHKHKKVKIFKDQLTFADLKPDDVVYSRTRAMKGIVIKHTGEMTYIEWENGDITGHPSYSTLSAENIEKSIIPIKTERAMNYYIGTLPYYYYKDQYFKGEVMVKGDKAILKLGEAVIEVTDSTVAKVLQEQKIDDLIAYRFYKDWNPVPLDQGQEDQVRMYWMPGYNEPKPAFPGGMGINKFPYGRTMVTSEWPTSVVKAGIGKTEEEIADLLYAVKAEEAEVNEFIEYAKANPGKILVYKMPGHYCLYARYCSDSQLFETAIASVVDKFGGLGTSVVAKFPEEFEFVKFESFCQEKKIPLLDGVLALYYLYKTGQIRIIEEGKKDKKLRKYRVKAITYPYSFSSVAAHQNIEFDKPNPPYSPSQIFQELPYVNMSYFSRGM